jgi:hypothetical protein
MSVIFERSLAALKATGAKYIIVMPDGTEHKHGDLELAPKKRGKRPRLFPHGSITKHYLPFIKEMLPGQMVKVPISHFPPNMLVSGISSRAVDWWGKGSTITARNEKEKVIEVLRVL